MYVGGCVCGGGGGGDLPDRKGRVNFVLRGVVRFTAGQSRFLCKSCEVCWRTPVQQRSSTHARPVGPEFWANLVPSGFQSRLYSLEDVNPMVGERANLLSNKIGRRSRYHHFMQHISEGTDSNSFSSFA